MASLQKAIAQLMEGRAEQRPTPPDGGSDEAAATPAPATDAEPVSVAEFAGRRAPSRSSASAPRR